MAEKKVTDAFVLNMEWVISAVVLLGLALMIYSNFFFGFALIGLAMLMFGLGLKEIPAEPPHKGLITVWGKRTTKVKDEGFRLLAPFFPFFIDTINVKVVTINQEFQVQFFCKAVTDPLAPPDPNFKVGLEVKLTAGITYKPNSTGVELQQYLNNGGEVGVRNILDDILPQVLRTEGTTRTFEELTAAKEHLINSLFRLMTDEDLGNLTADERRLLLLDVQQNGRKDIHGLGITITKINVGEPEPTDDIKKAAQGRAKEEFERRSEVYEVETEVNQARVLLKAYQDAGETRSLESCIQEIRRRKSIREGHGQVFDVAGLEGLAAGLLSKFTGNGNPPGATPPPAPPTPGPGNPPNQRRRQNRSP